MAIVQATVTLADKAGADLPVRMLQNDVTGVYYNTFFDPNTLDPIDPTSSVPVAGADAHDAVPAANPIGLGGLAATALPTAVAAGDMVRLIADPYGRLIVRSTPRDLLVHNKITLSSTTTETTALAAGAAGIYHDVYSVIVTNTSSTPTEVSFKDATSGTTRFKISAPANDTRGFTISPDAAITQATAANNWTATCADSVADIEITILAVKNK